MPPSSHGGARPGAGRPKGSGRYGEPTRSMRVPESVASHLERWLAGRVSASSRELDACLPARDPPPLELVLYANRVAAGFPSPADDYVEGRLDLNRYLIKHPAATFFVRVAGDSMLGAGIHPGDLLVVDRALNPTHGRVVIAVVNGELTVKRLCQENNAVWLQAENDLYPPIPLDDEVEVKIWGVVTNVIHPL